MKRIVALALALATPCAAQTPDPHAGHAGHNMPPPAAPAPAADPHAGHQMPAGPAAPTGEPPTVPTDHAADRYFSPAAMAAARETLRREHGVMNWTTVRLETAEVRPARGAEAYGWEGDVSWGGDIHRLVLKSEGDGRGDEVEEAEVQALYSRAIGPYFDAQAGLRQDLQSNGPRRTYAVVGVQGVAPYWFELEAQGFLSSHGELTARIEASYDLRLTQSWILEPRAEATLSAQDTASLRQGAGLTDIELGLRLRYAITQEFAPYVGVNWQRKLGDTADYARAAGHGPGDTRLVLGVRAWF